MFHEKKINQPRRIAVCGMLTALAIVLALAERFFPLEAVIPVPGIKLGLANVVTLFAISALSKKEAFAIFICRVIISSVLMGSVTAFLFSFTGGALSMLIMSVLMEWEGKAFTIPGISVAGAAGHNTGQIAAAALWMKTTAVVSYLPALLMASVPLGLITGLTASAALNHLKKIDLFSV